MTRSPGPATRLQYRTFGVPHAHRAVLVLREGAAAVGDPLPEVTATHDVRIIAVRLWPREIVDPGAYGGETPATTTVEALLALVHDQLTVVGDRIGLVGVGDAGAVAILLAGRSPDLFDRVALVGVPRPEGPLERDIAARSLAIVSAPILVVGGTDDPVAPPDDARWHADRLSQATIILAPRRPGSLDPRLSVTDVWADVLAHVAPQN